MSFVSAAAEALVAAASKLADIGSTLGDANATALAPTTAPLAAGADGVSAAIASVFSGHALGYQEFAGQVSALHNQFVQALSSAGNSYGSAESANVAQLARDAAAPPG